jgi:hypothetical protein
MAFMTGADGIRREVSDAEYRKEIDKITGGSSWGSDRVRQRAQDFEALRGGISPDVDLGLRARSAITDPTTADLAKVEERRADVRATNERAQKFKEFQDEQRNIQAQQESEARVNAEWQKFTDGSYATSTERNNAFQAVVDAEYADAQLKGSRESRNEVELRIKTGDVRGQWSFGDVTTGGPGGDPPGGDPQGVPNPTVIREIGEAVASGDMSKKQAKDALALLGFDESQQDATITAALGRDGLPSKEPDPGLLDRLKGALSDFFPGEGILDRDDTNWWWDDEDSLTGDPDVDLSGIQIPQTQAQREEARFQTKQGPQEIYANYLNRALPEGASNLYRSFLEGREGQLTDLFGQRRALGLAGPVPTYGDVQGAPGGQTFAGYLRGLGPHQSTYGQRSDLFNRTAGLWEPEPEGEFSPSELEYRDTLEGNPMTQYNLVSSREMMGVPKVLRAAAQRRIFQDYSKWRQAVSDAGTGGTQRQPDQFVTQYANMPNRWQ